MRVGVIGAGAAGLVTAWLLDEAHEVTLFERDHRLGGHADTRTIEVDGRPVEVDAGFQFFSPGSAYATFNRLLDALGVERESYAATLTLTDTRASRSLAMPPIRGARVTFPSLAPDAIGTLLRFRSFLDPLPEFLARRDSTVTVAEYLEQARLPKPFIDEFLVPLLLAFWCVEREEFLGFAAVNAFHYLGVNATSGLRAPVQSEIPGGLRVYVDALAASLERTRVRTDAAITRITRADDAYRVTAADGSVHEFDRLVLACNPRQAAELIAELPGLDRTRTQLERFRTFETRIAIHGDARFMPPHEASWSVVNARWDGAHSSLTVWNPRRGLPVFKSWVTHDDELPDEVYALATYEHGMITPEYFDAQSRLKGLNGAHGLWLAGLYMHDVDSHESAVRSAVAVAHALAPDTSRLRALIGPR
ncbi:Predicted NAD/FAD-binding protein [Agromyces sp. CF514]|uniref:FAD-dependent oxidoreductase n=1 Tax=Agromyces sp. CF514 TaxID=1881031 RepID=UPI0008EA616F|nr:FAD-dependent oxidoreductase [Agromyces sp. CF514]SFR87611.1 Predicted NAD/FAD-binding protein [Agromyces sp. CF514]